MEREDRAETGRRLTFSLSLHFQRRKGSKGINISPGHKMVSSRLHAAFSWTLGWSTGVGVAGKKLGSTD